MTELSAGTLRSDPEYESHFKSNVLYFTAVQKTGGTTLYDMIKIGRRENLFTAYEEPISPRNASKNLNYTELVRKIGIFSTNSCLETANFRRRL